MASVYGMFHIRTKKSKTRKETNPTSPLAMKICLFVN